MRKLKITDECAVNTEEEAKDLMESYRQKANMEGYMVGSAGYVKKEKKSKGEIIAEQFIVKIVKVYGGVWDEI